MFDIGFFELALIGVVLLLVMGPERLPEVARQIAVVIRKARRWMYSIKAEMNLSDEPIMQEIRQAKNELSDLGRDVRQLGDDLVQEAAQLDATMSSESLTENKPSAEEKPSVQSEPLVKKKRAKKRVSKKTTKKVVKKATKKTTKKVTKKTAKKAGKS